LNRAKRSDSEGEMKSTRGVFRCRQVPGSEPGKNGKGRVERLKVEAGAANQYAATRVRADPAGTINFTRACPGGRPHGRERRSRYATDSREQNVGFGRWEATSTRETLERRVTYL
jgi:hypothetical protein